MIDLYCLCCVISGRDRFQDFVLFQPPSLAFIKAIWVRASSVVRVFLLYRSPSQPHTLQRPKSFDATRLSHTAQLNSGGILNTPCLSFIFALKIRSTISRAKHCRYASGSSLRLPLHELTREYLPFSFV